MTARRVSQLLFLLLVWTQNSCVLCQTARVNSVSTDSVEITWTRELLWLGVREFTLHFTSTGSDDCNVTIPCSSPTCRFNSSEACSPVSPCTETNTTVSGGNHIAPSLVLVTGPEPVTDFKLTLRQSTEYITWVNPPKSSSPCYRDTAVQITFNNTVFISYFELGEENTSKYLCDSGSGTVEVFTRGGDGLSNPSTGPITYNRSSAFAFVELQTCKAVECNGIELTWFYDALCPDIAYFAVNNSDSGYYQLFNTSVTNLTFTGLPATNEYDFCVSALREDKEVLAKSCDYECRNAEEVVENMTLVVLNSTALSVTWDPPTCIYEPFTGYYVTATSNYFRTENTSCVLSFPWDFQNYAVEVQPQNEYAHGTPTTKTARTMLPTPVPWLEVKQDYILAQWNYSYFSGFVITFKVTWGPHLRHEALTLEKSYTIKGFSTQDQVARVCVTGIPEGMEDLSSFEGCVEVETCGGGSENSNKGPVLKVWLLLFVMHCYLLQ